MAENLRENTKLSNAFVDCFMASQRGLFKALTCSESVLFGISSTRLLPKLGLVLREEKDGLSEKGLGPRKLLISGVSLAKVCKKIKILLF